MSARETAWDDVRELLEWKPQELDAEVLTRAHEIETRFLLNWWDCLIVAAARAQGCVLLLTEDLQDGANYGGVIARNPFKLSVAEQAAAYAPSPRIASRHRGRGRPRRNPKVASASYRINHWGRVSSGRRRTVNNRMVTT